MGNIKRVTMTTSAFIFGNSGCHISSDFSSAVNSEVKMLHQMCIWVVVVALGLVLHLVCTLYVVKCWCWWPAAAELLLWASHPSPAARSDPPNTRPIPADAISLAHVDTSVRGKTYSCKQVLPCPGCALNLPFSNLLKLNRCHCRFCAFFSKWEKMSKLKFLLPCIFPEGADKRTKLSKFEECRFRFGGEGSKLSLVFLHWKWLPKTLPWPAKRTWQITPDHIATADSLSWSWGMVDVLVVIPTNAWRNADVEWTSHTHIFHGALLKTPVARMPLNWIRNTSRTCLVHCLVFMMAFSALLGSPFLAQFMGGMSSIPSLSFFFFFFFFFFCCCCCCFWLCSLSLSRTPLPRDVEWN